MTEYRFTVPSERSSIKLIDPFLRGKGIPDIAESRYHDLLVVLTEAVNNAIVHGNAGDPTKEVSIVVSVHATEIVATVRDMGSGFDPDQVPDPRLPENLLKEGGRGVFLIRQLADDVEYSVDDDGTNVRITIAL